jgi:hypothetical protein
VTEEAPEIDGASQIDPDTFDLDGWIDGVTRSTEIVHVYAKGHLNERLKEIERQIDVVKGVRAEDRSITDDSEESLREEWVAVAAELTDSALPVKVQALTAPELEQARAEAKKAKAADSEYGLWIVTAGAVSPTFTVEQLRRLRDRGGDAGIAQMMLTILRLSNETPRPSVPLSLRRSAGTRG